MRFGLARWAPWCVAAGMLVACTDRAITLEGDGMADDDAGADGDSEGDGDGSSDPRDDEPSPEPPCTPGQPGCPCPDGTVLQGDQCAAPMDSLVAVSPLTVQALAKAATEPAPVVQLFSADGVPLSGVEIAFAATQGDGQILNATNVLTDAEGVATPELWIIGPLAGTYAVTASVPSRPNVSPVTFTAETLGDWDITLQYINPVTDQQAAAFEYAERRWEGIILNALEAVDTDAIDLGFQCGVEVGSAPLSVTGVHIFVELGPIDGPGNGEANILGQAGPCVLRDDLSPAAGIMRFDTFDLDQIAADGKLETVILHEMGHVIGIGGLWSDIGLVENPSIPDNAGADTHFTGANAQQAFLSLLGDLPYEGAIVPVENQAQPGSSDGHWRESVMTTELMTPRLGDVTQPTPLSILTIASLIDNGFYEVNPYPADPYSFLSKLTAPSEVTTVPRRDEILKPRAMISADGVITALP